MCDVHLLWISGSDSQLLQGIVIGYIRDEGSGQY